MANGLQTSISQTPTVALAGQLVDSAENDVLSYVSEEASEEIPFGVMVMHGTADDQCLLLDGTAAEADDKLLGVTVRSQAYAKDTELGDTGVKPKNVIGILRKGRIWVEVEEAVTPQSKVRVRVVDAGSEVPGAFRDTADDTDDCILISSFARYVTSAGAGELAQLEIDMTGALGLAVADS